MSVSPERVAVADAAKGWLNHRQGDCLYEAALAAPAGPIVEVGSYCGKSTVYLGAAAQERGFHVFAVDHHLGSIEMQPDRENHDLTVVDPYTNRHDTLMHFRHTIFEAELIATVIPVAAPSLTVANYWNSMIGMVFIDADHSYPGVKADYKAWAPHVVIGGFVAFHDTTIPDIMRCVKEAMQEGFEMYDDSDVDLRILRRVA